MTMVRGTQFLCFLLCVSSVFLGEADIEKRGLEYLQETMGISGHPTMSSEWSEGYSAAKCMDGNWDTYCYNKRGGDDKPFFAVELPASVRINQVRLITAKSHPEKAENIVVIVTNDISSSGTQLGSTFKGPATKGKEFITFKSETGVTGKYVVVKQGKGVITFAEVQVNPEEMCTGRYRTPSGTKCVGMCQIQSGYWGNSWCYTNQTTSGPWGAPCKKCSDCISGKGENYAGTVSQTTSGYTCQKWSSQSPHSHGFSSVGDHNYCRNPDGEKTIWCYTTGSERWDYCTAPSCDIDKEKQAYLALKNDGSKKYLNSVKELLPKLLSADALGENEIGVAYPVTHQTKYPLALLSGHGIITSRLQSKTVEINGTVNKIIGKRTYKGKHRPIGLFANPGDVLSITIPEALVSKISARIGDDKDKKFMLEFPLTKSTQKIGSPYGGLIIIMLNNIEATNKIGSFSVQIENGIQAPYFVYTKNTNEEWNNHIKENAAPWAVLRIPGQLQIYIQTRHVKEATDMEGILKRWKLKMDTLEDLLGIPPNLQPGEEQLIFDPDTAGGLHCCGCNGAKTNWVTDSYYPNLFKEPKNGWGLVYHEFGHGYFYCDIPGLGGQWYADFIAGYMKNKLHNYNPKEDNWDLNLLYKMVSFAKFSKGQACGEADFNYGSDKWLEKRSYKNSYSVMSYYNCWRDIYYLPIWEFGWNVLYKILNTNGKSNKSYNSRTDRLADLMCKATEKNMIPLFKFYNLKVSNNIAEDCEKQKKPDMIMKFINIANCVKDDNIYKCIQLPGFPYYKGICTFSGTCNQSPDYNNQKIEMKHEFDLWGATSEDLRGTSLLKTGNKETGAVKENCLSRAEEMYLWCKNKPNQPITASFASRNGMTKFTIPSTIENTEFKSGTCYDVKPIFSVLPKYLGGFSNMVPEVCIQKCKAKSFDYAGVTFAKHCSCGMAPPFPNRILEKSQCNKACSGDNTRKCGGWWKMNVFKVQ